MTAKTILITGSTSGMGKAAASVLAKQGHRIILHGRDETATRNVQQQIIAESNNRNVDYLIADLFLMSDIRKMAENFKKKYDRLDVLFNNAGATMGKEREETSEGIEKTIALNLLAPFLLTSLLLDELQKRPDARIVNTASAGHSSMAKPDFHDLESKDGYTAYKAYGNAKLFLIMISQVMAEKLKQKGMGNITVNTLHPGIVINKGMIATLEKKGVLGKMMMPVLRLLTRTPEQGADTGVYLATSDEVKGMSGLYFSNRKPAKVNEKHISEKTKNIVWEYCESKTGMRNWQ